VRNVSDESWPVNLPEVIKLYNETPNNAFPIGPSGTNWTPQEMQSDYGEMVKRYKADKAFNKQYMERNKTFFKRFKAGDRVRYLEDTYPTALKKYIPRYTRAVYRISARDGHKYLLRPVKPLSGSRLAKNLRALKLSGFRTDEIRDED